MSTNQRFNFLLAFVMILSAVTLAQFPDKQVIVHPYASFEGRGNLFTIGQNSTIYIGTTTNKIYKLFNHGHGTSQQPLFEIISVQGTAGEEFDTGCIDLNGNYFILGNTRDANLIVTDTSGNYVQSWDFTSEGIVVFNWLFRMSATEYYLGVGHTSTPDPTTYIVKFTFNPSSPGSSGSELIQLYHADLNNITYTTSIVAIGDYLFIATDKGKIIRSELNDPTNIAVFSSGTDGYIRFIQTDGIRLFAGIESDIDKRFWRIENPITAGTGLVGTLRSINFQGDPPLDTYVSRMYVYDDKLYTHNGIIYDIGDSIFISDMDNGFPPGPMMGVAYNFIGGYQDNGYHYLFGYNATHQYKQIGTKEIIWQKVEDGEGERIKLVNDIELNDEGSILQTIESKGNTLFTGTYYDGFLHKYDVSTENIQLIATPDARQADAIKKIPIGNPPNDYIFYGCLGGTSLKAFIHVLDPSDTLSDVMRLPGIIQGAPKTDSSRWARITSIASDNNYVYFGTGEHFSLDRAVKAVIIYDNKDNFQNLNFDFEHSTSAQIIDSLTASDFYEDLSDNGNHMPIRFIALEKSGDYLYGIVGTSDMSLNSYETSYFFRLDVTSQNYDDYEIRQISDPLRRNFSRTTLKIINNSYILVGAGTEIWKYYLNSPIDGAPSLLKQVGDLSVWQEDHIRAIDYKNGKIYVCLANKIKILNENFQQVGYYRTPDNLDTFADMVINGNDIYVVTPKGYLYRYAIQDFEEYSEFVHSVAGDFDNDGVVDDLAEIYNYEDTIYGTGLRIRIKTSNGNKFVDNGIWSDLYYFDPNKVKHFAVGDFDNDGFRDDIATLYDYTDSTAIHLFKSTGSSGESFIYQGNAWGPNDWFLPNLIRHVASGDFDNDNKFDDIAVIYGSMAIHLFKSNGSYFDYKGNAWGPSTSLNYNSIKHITSGRFDNDSKFDDIAVIYKIENIEEDKSSVNLKKTLIPEYETAIHLFKSNSSSDPSFVYQANAWQGVINADFVKYIESIDFDNDAKIDDIAAIYDNYGSTAIHVFKSNNASSPSFSYQANTWGPFNWFLPSAITNVAAGNFNINNRLGDIAMYYSSNDETNIHAFVDTSPNTFDYQPYWFRFDYSDPNFSASISGPSSLLSKQSATYTAVVVGGSGSYSYQWWKKSNTSSTWQTLGNSQTQIVTMGAGNQYFDLKVWVDDNISGASTVGILRVLNGVTKSSLNSNDFDNTPISFMLHNAYPNPFNPEVTIKYQIPKPTKVKIVIYNVLGQKVKTLVNKVQDANFYSLLWDSKNDFGVEVASGIYILRMETDEFVKSIKLILLK